MSDGFWTKQRQMPQIKLRLPHWLHEFLNGIGHALEHGAKHRGKH